MSTEVAMHKVRKIEISEIRINETFASRDITVTDWKGDTLTITLFSEMEDTDECEDLRIKY